MRKRKNKLAPKGLFAQAANLAANLAASILWLLRWCARGLVSVTKRKR